MAYDPNKVSPVSFVDEATGQPLSASSNGDGTSNLNVNASGVPGPTNFAIEAGGNLAAVLAALQLGTPTNIAAVAITAATPSDTYTPASGKKFRLLGAFLSVSVGAAVIFKYGAGHTEFLRTAVMAAGIGVAASFGKGLAPGAVNDHLFLDVTASGTVNGYLLLGADE